MAPMPHRLPAKPGQAPHLLGLRDVVVLVAAAAVLVALRLHAFALPLETDECNYIYVAGRLLAGDRLYVDVWDHQPPGIFALFAAASALFGDGPATFRWLATVASVVSMVLMFAIARRTAGTNAGYLAAGLFALCSADPGTAGEGCNREIFMNPPALAAVWLLLRAESPRLRSVLTAGLLIGLGSTIKTVMAAQWVLLAVWLGLRAWKGSQARRRLRNLVTHVAAFGAGPGVVWAVTFGYFAATGRLGDFWEAVFAFNLGYSDVSAGYWQRFADFFLAPIHRQVFEGTWVLWIAAGLAALALPVIRWRRPFVREGALLCYLAGSYWAVCLPGQFWAHYYYLMLPPLIVVLATALGHLGSLPPALGAAWWGRVVTRVVGTAVLLTFLATQVVLHLLVPTGQLSDKRSRDLWGRAQAANVAQVTDPDDTVLLYGHDVGVYYYSRRRCASRYTMVRALSEQYPGFAKRRAILLEDVRARRPRVVLLVERPFPALDAFLRANYRLVGIDFHDRRRAEPIMEAWMDRSRPVTTIDWNWHRSSVFDRE